VVPSQYVARAEDAVREVCDKLGLKTAELHASKVLRTSRGQALFAEFVRAMGRSGGAPVFTTAQKRYWIAGKIVETFLDPYYNKIVPWEFYNDVEVKQDLAAEISRLHDEPLREFAEAYRNPEVSALSRSALRFGQLFDLKGMPRLASWFRNSVAAMAEVAEDELHTHGVLPSGGLATVNLPVFVSFLSLLESLARYYGMDPVHIVHDESREFEPAYQWAFKIHEGARPDVELHLPNSRMVVYGFECVKSIRMVKSHEQPLVQAADLLVSAMSRYARHIVEGEKPPEWLAETMDITLPVTWLPARVEMGTFGEIIGSPRFTFDMNKGGLIRTSTDPTLARRLASITDSHGVPVGSAAK
jgi:hypothetical protein